MSKTEVNFNGLYGRQKLLELFQKISPLISVFSIVVLAITSRYPLITVPAFFMIPVVGIGFLKMSARKNRPLYFWSGITVMPLIFIVCLCGGPHSPTFIVGFTNLLFIVINFTRPAEKAGMIVLSLGTIVAGSLLSEINPDLILEGMLCLLIYLYIVNNLLSFSIKQGHQITQAKYEIQEKHKEITDSINYAERIQRTFLATKKMLDENLNGRVTSGSQEYRGMERADSNSYFVFFQPKDVVSGDFYWASRLNDGRFALVTADSTGHGVPGAIMSLLNISSLEKAIENHSEPSAILNRTRNIIIDRLKRDGSAEGGKDGMDCSLCIYDFSAKKISVSASNNPVWIVRASNNGPHLQQNLAAELIEIAPDKMPVGKHDKDEVSFTQHELALQKGDIVYTFTDGLPDQFGGTKGKKLMYKRLRELLLSVASDPMEMQKQKISAVFSDWKGNLEQVDDVCIIGVRI